MNGAGPWQPSSCRDYESDNVHQDGQGLAAMPLPLELTSMGPAVFIGPEYHPHGAFPQLSTVYSEPDINSVSAFHPGYEYGTCGDSLTYQIVEQERGLIPWSSEGNTCEAPSNVESGLQNILIASASPPFVPYPQEAEAISHLDPATTVPLSSLEETRTMAYLPLEPDHIQQSSIQSPGTSAQTTSALSSVSEQWDLLSPHASTFYSSNSDRNFPLYGNDIAGSRPSSQNSSDGKSSSPPPEIKATIRRMSKGNGSNEHRNSQHKIEKISPLTSERAHKTKVSKRKGKLNPDQRSKAAEMRKAGRCLRCAVYKLGCDLGDPCDNCVRILNSPRSFRQPCVRADLKSVKLIRQCNGRFGQETVSFRKYKWAIPNEPPSSMEIKWILPGNVPINVSKISIPFKRYIPEPSDHVDTTAFHFNMNGHVGRIDLPPYAVSDTTELLNTAEAFLFQAQPEVEGWIRNRFQNDTLKSATFSEACRYREQYGSSLIAKAIKMQCGAIMTQGSGSVLNCFDIELIDYGKFGYSGYEAYNRGLDRPLPQAIAHQFDVAMLQKINEWQKDFLKDLKSKVFMSGAKPWYEIFLACFVLLSNLEYIYGGALAYLQTKLSTRLESQVRCIINQQIAKWNLGARVLLHYFRNVAKAHIPFVTQRVDPAGLKAGGFDDDTILYLGKVVNLLRLECKGIGFGDLVGSAADWRPALEPNCAISPSTDAAAPCCWSRLLFSEEEIP